MITTADLQTKTAAAAAASARRPPMKPCLPICAQVDKHRLVHELNIPYRDLRILDPMVATPYPCALLVREKALVVNLEAVRCALVSSLPSSEILC